MLRQASLQGSRADACGKGRFTLLKLRQLGEALAQYIASRLGIDFEERTTQIDLLRKVQQEINLPREVIEVGLIVRQWIPVLAD